MRRCTAVVHPCLVATLVLGGILAQVQAVSAQASSDELVARAATFELDTDYTPPPGEELHHHTAGFARTLCSAVFLTGLDPDDAARNIGGFTSPFLEREHVVRREVDREAKTVSLTLPDAVRCYRGHECSVPVMLDSAGMEIASAVASTSPSGSQEIGT